VRRGLRWPSLLASAGRTASTTGVARSGWAGGMRGREAPRTLGAGGRSGSWPRRERAPAARKWVPRSDDG
jgi:hypothetical protein